jgi:hypothetical protein
LVIIWRRDGGVHDLDFGPWRCVRGMLVKTRGKGGMGLTFAHECFFHLLSSSRLCLQEWQKLEVWFWSEGERPAIISNSSPAKKVEAIVEV